MSKHVLFLLLSNIIAILATDVDENAVIESIGIQTV